MRLPPIANVIVQVRVDERGRHPTRASFVPSNVCAVLIIVLVFVVTWEWGCFDHAKLEGDSNAEKEYALRAAKKEIRPARQRAVVPRNAISRETRDDSIPESVELEPSISMAIVLILYPF